MENGKRMRLNATKQMKQRAKYGSNTTFINGELYASLSIKDATGKRRRICKKVNTADEAQAWVTEQKIKAKLLTIETALNDTPQASSIVSSIRSVLRPDLQTQIIIIVTK